jgi:rubrerythrin
MGKRPDDRAALVRQLQRAYSGELAAALAYRGHWRATREGEDRTSIRTIEEEEWHHRRLVGAILDGVGARPSVWLEVRAWLVGRTLGLLCHVAGWFLPMYGAGRLESRNVGEYERAAKLAVDCGRADLVEGLLAMAEVEWDHEAYFRSCVERHPARRWFPLWPPPR